MVCASSEVAIMKFATWMIASCGPTTLKYATGFTFTDTLSRVITSSDGTSTTIVRKSTRTIC